MAGPRTYQDQDTYHALEAACFISDSAWKATEMCMHAKAHKTLHECCWARLPWGGGVGDRACAVAPADM